MLYGSTNEDHDARLHGVLEGVETNGLVAIFDKLEFSKRMTGWFASQRGLNRVSSLEAPKVKSCL